MSFLVVTALTALFLLGVEWIFHLSKRGRTVLALIYLTWTLLDAFLSARENSDHLFGAFAFSFLDSVLPLVLWQWTSSWIRKSLERHHIHKLKPSQEDSHSQSISMNTELRTQVEGHTLEHEPAPMHSVHQSLSSGVVTISADAAKRLFPEYVKDPTGADRDVAVAARMVSNGALDKELAYAPEPGRDIVLICAGSPGSGKTTTLSPRSDPAVGLKIEETLDELEEARSLIQRVLDSGRKPVILWVYVDAPGKTVQRMFRRAMKIGRTDQIEYMARAYANVPKVLSALSREFGGRLKVHVADNSGLRGEMQFIEDSSRIWSEMEDAIATRVGLSQVDETNRMFRENPDFEVEY